MHPQVCCEQHLQLTRRQKEGPLTHKGFTAVAHTCFQFVLLICKLKLCYQKEFELTRNLTATVLLHLINRMCKEQNKTK